MGVVIMNLSPGIYAGLPFEEYLAIEAANASSLKLARKSIAHMLVPRTESTAFDLGHSVHSLVLEGLDAFRERTAIRPREFKSYREKDARAWRDEMLADGLTVLTHEEAELVKHVAKNISEHPAARELLELSKPRTECRELTYVWHEDEWGVPCKARADMVADGSILVDLKTARTAFGDDFARAAIRYGYDLQAAHYARGFEVAHGRRPDAFVIIAVETEEPYGVAVYHITDDWLERGAWQRELALDTWSDWYHDGRPDDVTPYSQHITTLELPRWA